MKSLELKINYMEYDSLDELSPKDRELAQAALDAVRGAYSPYSHFRVGAAVRLSTGEIATGANQENIAYPSGLCAERTAMFHAGATRPDAVMEALAVAAEQNGTLCALPATPCGACRQVMAEYQTKAGKPMEQKRGRCKARHDRLPAATLGVVRTRMEWRTQHACTG